MRFCFTIALAATIVVSAAVASAAVPPAPAQAVAAAQGLPPQAGVPPGTTYTNTFTATNPSVLPPSPGNAGADSSRYLWNNDRWWYWTPQNTWLLYGQTGWSNPSARTSPYATSVPSGYTYKAGSTYYSYPGFGNYYPSRVSANPGMSTTNQFPSNPAIITNQFPSNPVIITNQFPSNPSVFTNQSPSNPRMFNQNQR